MYAHMHIHAYIYVHPPKLEQKAEDKENNRFICIYTHLCTYLLYLYYINELSAQWCRTTTFCWLYSHKLYGCKTHNKSSVNFLLGFYLYSVYYYILLYTWELNFNFKIFFELRSCLRPSVDWNNFIYRLTATLYGSNLTISIQ